MLSNREVITVKAEATYNVDPIPVGGDAVLAEKVAFSYANTRIITRTPIKQTLGSNAPIYAGSLGQLVIEAEVKGSGTAGAVPELDALYQACSLFGTVVALTSVTYKPVSTGQKSCTIYYYQDGRLRKLTGCRGSVQFKLAVGDKPMAVFTMVGHMPTASVTDVPIVSATYDATVPVPIIGVAFSCDSFAHVITSLSIDLGNATSAVAAMGAIDGYGEVRVTKRDVKGSFDPESNLAGVYNLDSKFKSSAAYALTSGVIGAAAGNRMAFTLPAVVYSGVSEGDREGVRSDEISFMASDTVANDDDFQLAFT